MKKLILASALFWSSLSYAQITYHPYPENYGTWLFEQMVFTGSPEYSYHRYVWSGETTINAQTYTKVYASSTVDDNNIVIPMNYIGGIRQDIPNQKLYFIDLSENEYDISVDQFLEVGDTIPNTPYLGMAFAQTLDFFDNSTGQSEIAKFLVESVDSIETADGYRSKYTLTFIGTNNQPFNQGEYIEYVSGIGAQSMHLFEAGKTLHCHSEGDSMVVGSDISPWTYACELSIANHSEIEFTLSPNPANDVFTVEASGHQLKHIEVIDLIGNTVLQQTSASVDIHSLNAGVYTVIVHTNSGNASRKIIKL